MRLFGLGGTPEDPAARERREASQREIERGALPLNAVDRLREQAARQGTPQHLFTSDLSVNELLLTRQAGHEALGQVMGSSIYHVGWQYVGQWYGASGENTVLTQAFYHARHLALSRLQQEAALLAATGVIGVRLEHKEYSWGADLLEFMAIGTAIREVHPQEGAGSLEHPLQIGKATRPAAPFLSALSGQDYWLLRQGGYRPLGIVIGNCSYYQIPTWQTQQATTGGWFGGGAWQNMELADYTQGVYNARALAMSRMEDEARGLGATGVIGADVVAQVQPREMDVNNQRRIDMLYHFTAIGTAIAAYTYARPPFAPANAVTLGGG